MTDPQEWAEAKLDEFLEEYVDTFPFGDDAVVGALANAMCNRLAALAKHARITRTSMIAVLIGHMDAEEGES